MQLTNPEKLIISMLAELHEKAGIEVEQAQLIKRAIYSNNTWALSWELQGIVGDDREETPPLVSDVVNILDMWSFLEEAMAALPEKDAQEVRDAVGRTTEFIGFDGNNESEAFSTAVFLIGPMKRFESYVGRDMNSHIPTLDRYRAMYQVFKDLRPNLGYRRTLSREQLIQVMNA